MGLLAPLATGKVAGGEGPERMKGGDESSRRRVGVLLRLNSPETSRGKSLEDKSMGLRRQGYIQTVYQIPATSIFIH
jgi:hypothetical protein